MKLMTSIEVGILVEDAIENIRVYQHSKFRKHMNLINSKNRIWKFFFANSEREKYLNDNQHLKDLEFLECLLELCKQDETVYVARVELNVLKKWSNKDEV